MASGPRILLIISITVICLAAVLIPTLIITLRDDEPDLEVNQDELIVNPEGEMQITKQGEPVLEGKLGTLFESSAVECEPVEDHESCFEWAGLARLQTKTEVLEEATCHHFSWNALTDTRISDCYDLEPAHWYGAAEMFYQYWPIKRWNKTLENYVSGDLFRDQYGSVLERYWLSSYGVGIRVSNNSPLHVSVNANNDGKLCFVSTFEDSYYPNPDDVLPFLDYEICTGSNVRTIHDYTSAKYVSKPSEWPDERMIKSPIWSTWAQYKIFINESEIIEYARNIRDNGFNNSQLEIDDGFQLKYGDFDFDPNKFSNVSGMVDQLHQMGFRVTLWTTPFANANSNAYQEGDQKGYWVKRANGQSGLVPWWNGLAGMLDVTNPEACDWFVDRLENVRQELGFDSFKFDAGETNYLVNDFVTHEQLINPCEYTTKYVEMCARLGKQIEVRVGFENQNQPVFVRMMDKESAWGWDNGLKTLITTALTFNILGYPYVLPDMIGGNVYDEGFHSTKLPSRELFIRWLQLTAFLPSMQYSISPWQYDEDVVDIALRWTSFHENVITPILLRIIREEVVTEGKPLNRPVWWIAPEDPIALVIDSEFLVGDEMLVAPIVTEGALSRDVYLPEGAWYDHLHGETVQGGQWLYDVGVPLDETLYYTRQ